MFTGATNGTLEPIEIAQVKRQANGMFRFEYIGEGVNDSTIWPSETLPFSQCYIVAMVTENGASETKKGHSATL